MGEDGPGGEAPSQAPNFNACWDELRKLKLRMDVLEIDESTREDAKRADEKGDHARSQIAIKTRLKALLSTLQAWESDRPLTLADLERLDIPSLGRPEGHAHDIVGDLLYDSFADDWKPTVKELAAMKKDSAYQLRRQKFSDYNPRNYAWDQILRRLFYGKQ